jgi:putative selenium metabolism hydrolase
VLFEDENIQPDYVILGEPTNLQIIRGHRGRMMFEVNVHGKSSHASNPDLGKNAIIGAARLIFGFDLLAVDLPSDPFLGASTIAVTRVESQAPSKNTIPSTCKLYVDRRLTLGETASRAQAEMEQVVQREGVYAEMEIVEYQETSYTGYEFALSEAYNAWALDRDHPLVQAASSALHAITGQQPAVGHCSFSTDGVYTMAELNIPTLGFGPGKPEHAHTINDQVRLSDAAQAAQAYALLASMLLA